MFWDTAKSVGGFVAGAASARITTLLIEELTKRRVGVFIPIGEPKLYNMRTVSIEHSRAEKVVLVVGTMVISAAVGSVVGNYTRREIGELEEIINELSEDIKRTIEEAKHGSA